MYFSKTPRIYQCPLTPLPNLIWWVSKTFCSLVVNSCHHFSWSFNKCNEIERASKTGCHIWHIMVVKAANNLQTIWPSLGKHMLPVTVVTGNSLLFLQVGDIPRYIFLGISPPPWGAILEFTHPMRWPVIRGRPKFLRGGAILLGNLFPLRANFLEISPPPPPDITAGRISWDTCLQTGRETGRGNRDRDKNDRDNGLWKRVTNLLKTS